MSERLPTYWDYIRVEDLLSLQGGMEQDESRLSDDEVLFITVHQVFELWFKLVLRELVALRDVFKEEVVPEQEMSNAVRMLERCAVIFGRAADHFQVMETMTTRDYLDFRDKLTPASGFQSAQMRQIEILLGLQDEERIALGGTGSFMEALKGPGGAPTPASARVTAQQADRPSVLEAIESWLWRTPIGGLAPHEKGAAEALDRFIDGYVSAQHEEIELASAVALRRSGGPTEAGRLESMYAAEKSALTDYLNPDEAEGGARRRRIRAACLFLLSYRELPLLAWPRQVLDGLVEMEQGLLVFRQRHARMVERVIGRRTGTGGSSGVDYLDKTALTYRVFRDIWAARTYQIRREACPPPENPEAYGFSYGG